MKALIRNYTAWCREIPEGAAKTLEDNPGPASLGHELAICSTAALSAARPTILVAFRMLHDLLAYACLAHRIASEGATPHQADLLDELEDTFGDLHAMVTLAGDFFARKGGKAAR